MGDAGHIIRAGPPLLLSSGIDDIGGGTAGHKEGSIVGNRPVILGIAPMESKLGAIGSPKMFDNPARKLDHLAG